MSNLQRSVSFCVSGLVCPILGELFRIGSIEGQRVNYEPSKGGGETWKVWIVWIIGIWNPVGTLNYVWRKLSQIFNSYVMLQHLSHPIKLGISMFCSCFIWLSSFLSHVIWGPRNPTESREQIKILNIFRGSTQTPQALRGGLYRP